ncbi:MAG: hypothetical protein ACHQYP_08590 [Nitrospiria bacterium]
MPMTLWDIKPGVWIAKALLFWTPYQGVEYRTRMAPEEVIGSRGTN